MTVLPDLEEAYFTTFDRAQAYELLGCDKNYEEHVKELQSELKSLWKMRYKSSSIDLEKGIVKINSMLDEFTACNAAEVSLDIRRFLLMKNRDVNIDDIVLDMLTQEINRLNAFVTAMRCRSNINVNQNITPKKHTEEGRLVKEKNCLLCNNVFNSKRNDAKYCSSKCKQAAYREKKYS